MSNRGIFKTVASNSLGKQTYQITYTMEGGEMPANFNPLMFMQGGDNVDISTNPSSTTTTKVVRGGNTITIQGSGGAGKIDLNQIMSMFKNDLDGDVGMRMGELNEICQTSTKQTLRKNPEGSAPQKTNTVTTTTTTTVKKRPIQQQTEVIIEKPTVQVIRKMPAGQTIIQASKAEEAQQVPKVEIPRVRGNVKKVIEDTNNNPEKPSPAKEVSVPKPKLPPKPVEDKFKTLPNELASVKKLEFQKQQEKVLTGKFSKEKNSPTSNIPSIDPRDCLETFGVASLWYQNSAYTDGRYNMNDWKVEMGSLGPSKAYRIHPPATKFSQFLGSRHSVCFMLPEKSSYKLYSFQDNCLTLVAEKEESTVKVGEFNVFPEAMISEIGAPIIYLVEKSSTRLSPYTVLKNGIDGATIFKDQRISIELIKVPVPEEPTLPEAFNHGPNTHENQYSPNRDHYRFNLPNKEAVVWTGPTNNIYLTQIDRLNITHKSIKLDSKKDHILAGATGNSEHVFYMVVQKGEGADKTKGISMFLIKADANTGKVVKQARLATDKENLNVWEFDTCMLVLNGTFIGMIITRRMTKHTDGLNHQGGLAAVFDTVQLKMVKNHGQTSGHSFGSSLTLRSDGMFMGMDLGDNYPRGVHCWMFDDKYKTDRVVYSFKTEHGKQPQSPAGVKYPPYDEISKNGQKFYKWSNDNRTYTELAAPGLIEQEDGIMAFFCGENLPHPFDNSRTKDYCNGSRNIGFVKVSKTLAKDESAILSQGPLEKGGFFCFNGKWNVLTNKGIQWVTKFNGEDNVSRLKATKLKDKTFVLFELWNKLAYMNTQYMIIEPNGSTNGPVRLDVKIRVHKADDIFFDERSESVIVYAGEKGKTLNRYEIRLAK